MDHVAVRQVGDYVGPVGASDEEMIRSRAAGQDILPGTAQDDVGTAVAD